LQFVSGYILLFSLVWNYRVYVDVKGTVATQYKASETLLVNSKYQIS